MGNLKEKLTLKRIAVALIAVAAIVHLILNYVHTSALLLLEDEICGFLMFIFILMGLVALFQATRVKDHDVMGKCVCALVCAATDFFGWKLTAIYRYALANQRALTPAPVQKALTLSLVLMAAFGAAAVLLVVDAVRDRAQAKHG